MERAKELFDAGELQAAIEELVREVKANPADTTRRIFLFELLCFVGEWDRAEKQLEVIGHQSAKAEIGVQAYRNNIKAERACQRLFTDGLRPHFLFEPPAYVSLHLEAINRLREGDTAEARRLLDRAEEQRPALSGKLNGEPFQDFRDWNDLVAPVLELIVQDHYTWLPLEQVKRLEITAPTQLRDLIWATAKIEATDEAGGLIGRAFIKTLYEGSSKHPNNQVKLGRMTDWKTFGEEVVSAVGLRLFLVDEEDKAILEVREVEFNPIPKAPVP